MLVIKGLCGAAAAWAQVGAFHRFFFFFSLLLTTNVWPLPGQTNLLTARVSQLSVSSLSLVELSVRGPFVPSVGLPEEERKTSEMGLGSGRQASSVYRSAWF